MGNLSALMAKQTLDWSLASAAPLQVAGNFVGLASVAISSTATTGEWATNIYIAGNYAHVTASMGAAAQVAGSASASNAANIVFGPVSVNGLVASGIFLNDQAVSGAAGTFLYWGSLAAPRTLTSGDTITFVAGALSITMA